MAATYDPLYKVNPPLRRAEDVEAVREASPMARSTSSALTTPRIPSRTKDCEWQAGAFGMTGLETALSVLIETMVEHRPHGLGDIARVPCPRPRPASAA